MKTRLTVSMVGILIALVVVRQVGERIWRERLDRIAGQLQQRHPDWRPTPDGGAVKPAALWRLLIFSPDRLPDDGELRREAAAFRRLAVIRLALLLGLFGALIFVTVRQRAP